MDEVIPERGSFGSGRRGVFVFLFFLDFAFHFAAEERSEKAIEKVGDEDDEGHPLVVSDGEKDEEGDDEKL